MKRYIARFSPQAWINNYAVSVDPEGPTEWDATAFIEATLREGLMRGGELSHANALEWLEATLAHGDHDDILHDDPAAPEWVREWHGPFDTYLEEVEA